MHRRRWPVAAIVGVAGAVVIAAWLTRAVWGDRPAAGEDMMFYLVRSGFGISHVYLRGALDGWSPRFYLGHEQFLVRGPDIVPFVALVRALTFGQLSNTGAVKAVGLVSFFAMPVATAFLARSYSLSRRAASVAALLTLVVSSPFGLGVQGLYQTGLLAHQVGAIWFAIALGCILRVPIDPRARWVVAGGGATAVLGLTHQISAGMLLFAAIVSLATLPLTDRVGVAAIRRLGLVALVALGLAAFWLLPRLAHGDLVGGAATWSTPPFGDRVGEIFDATVLFPSGVAAAAMVGWGYAVVRVLRRRRYAAAPVLVVALGLPLTHWAAHTWPAEIIAIQGANRWLGYFGLVGLLPLAALVGDVATAFAARVRRADVAVISAVAVAVLAVQGPWADVPGQFARPVPQLRAGAAELARVVPEGARFAVERDYPAEIGRTGVIHPETWLAWASGRDLLNGIGLESSTPEAAPFVPDRIGQDSPAESADALARLGVSHLVTTDPATATMLRASGRFRSVWSNEPLAVLEVVPDRGQPRPAALVSATSPLRARLADAGDDHVTIRYESKRASDTQVAIGWSPKWHATVDGQPVQLRRGPDSIIHVTLPAGNHVLALHFEADASDRVGIVVSVTTLIALTVLLVRRRRRAADASVERPTSG